MKKAILTLIVIFSMTNYSYAQPQAQTAPQAYHLKYANFKEKRAGLWKDFHNIRFKEFGGFQEINLYAEDDTLTRICFICEKGLFIFYWIKSEGTIEKIQHAKLIDYTRINRITFEKNNNFRVFKLWYYETVELSIGAH